MKFSIKDVLSKCDQIRRKTADLLALTEEIPNEKLHFFVQCHLLRLQQPISWNNKEVINTRVLPVPGLPNTFQNMFISTTR